MNRRLARIVLLTAASAPAVVIVLHALSTRWFFPSAWPDSLSLRHLSDVLREPGTRRAIGDGLAVSLLATGCSVVLAWPAAQVLARPGLHGRLVVIGILLLPSLLPPVGLAIGIDVFLLRTRVAGTVWGVALAHLAPVLPYVVAVLTAGFARHDRAIEAQAAVLGASDRQRLRFVTIPAMRRSIVTAVALGFVVSWSQYLLTVLVGSGRVVTITTLLFSALAGGNPTRIASLALLAAAPAVVLLAATATTPERPAP